MSRLPVSYEIWLPEGFAVELDYLKQLRNKKEHFRTSAAGTALSPKEAKELDRGTRDAALWHRLFGAELPVQGAARPCAVALPPGWKIWQRPTTPFARCTFDVQIEEALTRDRGRWGQNLEYTGVRCLYLEVRAEIRRWFWDIERAHGGYAERDEIAGKLKLLLETGSEVLRALDQMEDVISYLSPLGFPHDHENIDSFSKIWELYDEERFDERVEDLIEYISSLNGPTERYIKYFSPRDPNSQNDGPKKRGRKQGVGVDIRRRLFGINGMALFSFFDWRFPRRNKQIL